MERTGHDKVRDRLERAPVVGIYKGQNYDSWKKFYKYFIDFLLSEQGPRGDVIKLARSFFSEDPQKADMVLSVLGFDNKANIRDIYVAYKNYSPCKLYHTYTVFKQKLVKMDVNVELIKDRNSLMYKNIERGIKDKKGQVVDVEARMKEIQQDYISRHRESTECCKMMMEELSQNVKYIDYIKLKAFLKPVIQLWEKVDKETGNENVNRGKLFEEKCLDEGLKLLYTRLGRDNFVVFNNCSWQDRSTGEIDIALAEYIDGKLIVTILVQCKSRLFDIGYAHKQIGPERLKFNKRVLSTKKGLVPVSDNAQIFIMTYVPQREFILQFQSRLKGQIERITKNFTVSKIRQDQLYNSLIDKFSDDLSPLQWFNKNNQIVIVLS